MFSSINHTLKVCTKIPCIITASGLCPKCAGFPGGACHFVRQYQQQLHQYQPHCCVAVSIRVLYSCTKVLSYTLLRVSYVYVYRIRVLYSCTRTRKNKVVFYTLCQASSTRTCTRTRTSTISRELALMRQS